jgi:hypothetical protein
MAFFSQYRAIRGSEREDEVEYNFGRAFHQLGSIASVPPFASSDDGSRAIHVGHETLRTSLGDRRWKAGGCE